MFKADVKKVALRCFVLMLLVLTFFLTASDWTRGTQQSPQQTREKLSVASITHQDDAPLRIINTFVESEPGMLRLRITAQNQSLKRIRAYAIVADGGGVSRVDFVNLTKPAAIFQPTQVKTFDIAYSENNPSESVTLSVDFVEFDDGSVWGLDRHRSRDKLSGQREGAKAERRRLRELLKSKGTSAVLNAIREAVGDGQEAKTATQHSEEWLQGYRNGVSAIRHRLRQSLRTSDPARVELELAKPFDLSEEQPQ